MAPAFERDDEGAKVGRPFLVLPQGRHLQRSGRRKYHQQCLRVGLHVAAHKRTGHCCTFAPAGGPTTGALTFGQLAHQLMRQRCGMTSESALWNWQGPMLRTLSASCARWRCALLAPLKNRKKVIRRQAWHLLSCEFKLERRCCAHVWHESALFCTFNARPCARAGVVSRLAANRRPAGAPFKTRAHLPRQAYAGFL